MTDNPFMVQDRDGTPPGLRFTYSWLLDEISSGYRSEVTEEEEPQNKAAAGDAKVIPTVRGWRGFVTSLDINGWLKGRP